MLFVHIPGQGKTRFRMHGWLLTSKTKPVEQLSRERPLGDIFNLYVLLSVLLQFALHIVSLVYITDLSHQYEP